MPRTKGAKNKAKSETKPAAIIVEPKEPEGLNPKQKSKILARNWTITTIQKQIAELTIRLDEELDGLAQDVAGEVDTPKPKAKPVRRSKMQQQEPPAVFAPEQADEAGAELDV